MAGFDKVYYLGSEGGFMGADALNTIVLEILVGSSDRQWFEPRYWTEEFRPLAGAKVFIPEGPDTADGVLDAFLIFAPQIFLDEEGMNRVGEMLKMDAGARVDFDQNGVPSGWLKVRERSRQQFSHLAVYVAQLQQLNQIPQRQ